MTDFFHPVPPGATDRAARRWLQSIDPAEKVGTKHHVVPMMVLRRFASPSDQLYVRDRVSGVGSIRNARDLAIRDFNTVVTLDARLDSSLETLLSLIEGAAAAVLRLHLDAEAFARPRPFTEDEREKLDTFISMQFVRGAGHRRAYELATDYAVKLMNQGELTDEDVNGLQFVPHPNEYLQMSGQLAERAHEALAVRPLSLIRIDRPLFIIGDELVLLISDRAASEPDSSGYPKLAVPGINPEDVVQFQAAGGVGLANADVVIMPLSPRAALAYGASGTSTMTEPQTLRGDEAEQLADIVNTAVLKRAVTWVAAHPHHPTLRDMDLPDPVPLLRVFDGGSAMAKQVNTDGRRHPIRRVRERDTDEVDTALHPGHQRQPQRPSAATS